MKKIIVAVFFALLTFTQPVYAVTDPRVVPNNRFGIHIIDEGDLENASKLVNTNGDWGYVTVVIAQNDRNREKWQAVFDKMRRLHLIPLVRLATEPSGNAWKKPNENDAATWVNFLSSLNWVTQNRYVILFNEPNHAKEWGGSVYPEEYARVMKSFAEKLKSASPDYFILPAGMDVSAPNGAETMDAYAFWQKMIAAEPNVFTFIDGWNSHSYPNPGFTSSPYNFGRGSIRTFEWEQSIWGSLGIYRNLPIFITETGWVHSEGKVQNAGLPAQTASDNFKVAFESVWNNPNIVAITPFVLNYQGEPFDHFSWKKFESSEYYPQYETVQNLAKAVGSPQQIESVLIVDSDIPDKLINDSEYIFHITLENSGQSIWEKEGNYHLFLSEATNTFTLQTSDPEELAPFQRNRIEMKMKTPKKLGDFELALQMKKGEKVIGPEFKNAIQIVPTPNIFIKAKLWFKKVTDGSDFRFLVYERGEVKTEIQNVALQNGEGEIGELRNVVPNREYRFVLLKPFYLPVQVNAFLKEKDTRIEFPRFLPLDFNGDGAATFADIQTAFWLRPFDIVKRLLPW